MKIQIFGNPTFNKNLLLHYKSVDIDQHYFDDKHSNSWEITEIIRIFNSYGWNVELVDRTVSNWQPSRNYDLFISNASGSLGTKFIDFSNKIPSVPKILYAAGPAVNISDSLVDSRYKNFCFRHQIRDDVKQLRTYKTDINSVMNQVEGVICIDDNGFSSNTYKRFGKKIYELKPSSTPKSIDSSLFLRKRESQSIILFLGNGFIAKGADVVIDAIERIPEVNLEICGPYKSDKLFYSVYGKKLRKNSNFKLNGFLKVGSKKYFDVVKSSNWQIHYSAAEGCATAVTTLMQAGILPISNYESGVDTNNVGLKVEHLTDDFVSNAEIAIRKALNTTNESIIEMRNNLYWKSHQFSRNSFSENFKKIFENFCHDFNL